MERLLGHRQPKGPETHKPASYGYRASPRLYMVGRAEADLRAFEPTGALQPELSLIVAPRQRHTGQSPLSHLRSYVCSWPWFNFLTDVAYHSRAFSTLASEFFTTYSSAGLRVT